MRSTLCSPWWILSAAFVALTACGPEIGPPAAVLDDRCGEPEPTQLLALAADELVPAREDAFVVYGDRRLVTIGAYNQDRLVSSRVVSVDACGEGEPTLIAEGISRIIWPTQEGLPWLGCSALTGEMFIIDPEGEREPSPLGVVRLCHVEESPGRLWAQRIIDEREEILMMHPDPQTGSVTVATMAEVIPGNSSFAVADDHLWFVNDQHQLIQQDLESPLETTQLSDDAARVLVTRNGRFVVWGAEEFGTPGRWTVYDRESEEQFEVSVGEQSDVELRLIRHSLTFKVELDSQISRFMHIRLPSMDTTTFEGDWLNIFDTEAGDLVLGPGVTGGDLHVLTTGLVEPERLYTGNVLGFWTEGQDVLAWDYDDFEPDLVLDQEINTQLVRIPVDSRVPEVIVDEVYAPLRLDDDRWLQVRGWDRDGVGELRVIDRVEGTEQVVDRNVPLGFARRHGTERLASEIFTSLADGSFVYSVRGGERHGLWTAALAPAP